MCLSKGLLSLLTVYLITLATVKNVNGCSCITLHPQTQFCRSEFVIGVEVAVNGSEVLGMFEKAYKVDIIDNFKMSNNTILNSGFIYTPTQDSLCGVNLHEGEKYILSGYMYNGKPTVQLCNLVMRYSTVTQHQLEGFQGIYSENCNCMITDSWSSESKHEKACLLSIADDCDIKYGVCRMKRNQCTWIYSEEPYNQCVDEISNKDSGYSVELLD